MFKRLMTLRHVRDERGSELLEYAVALGLFVVAIIAALEMAGIRVLDRWHRILDLF